MLFYRVILYFLYNQNYDFLGNVQGASLYVQGASFNIQAASLYVQAASLCVQGASLYVQGASLYIQAASLYVQAAYTLNGDDALEILISPTLVSDWKSVV